MRAVKARALVEGPLRAAGPARESWRIPALLPKMFTMTATLADQIQAQSNHALCSNNGRCGRTDYVVRRYRRLFHELHRRRHRSGDGALNAPNALAFDAAGDVWVTTRNALVEMSSSGTSLGSTTTNVSTLTTVAINPK